MFDPCTVAPEALLATKMCLHALSKNIEGSPSQLGPLHSIREEECRHPLCTTLKTIHELKLFLTTNPACDSRFGELLDGVFFVRKLYTAHESADAQTRAVHIGEFECRNGPGTVIAKGRLSGITNAGTHREPVFGNCQPCDGQGYMEGHFCGVVTDWKIPELKECSIMGTYRLRYDAAPDAVETASVVGTLEGSILCPCEER